MANMINYGIDLGTTNSLIAKFNKGEVLVFKNPSDQGAETLPSVVGFRNDRILVGKQARTYAERDPENVVSRFKRKMGTTEAFHIKSLGQTKSPTELSAFVLKTLKTFIHTGEVPEAVVITIPACFDTIQANATEEAGFQAGFKQVVLLNEPIAASLAYANKEKNVDLNNSQWIVYDLGGGTFDVALVKIVEGELKVLDHEGNNYLGGSDFDALMVEKLIAPELEKRGQFANLVSEMKSASGKHNRLWHILLHAAEQAKIVLSAETSAEIDLSVKDDAGKDIPLVMTITRSEFEGLIRKDIDDTAAMLKTIVTRNSLRPQDLKFVLMVGGQTATPFVRKRIEELLGIPVERGIDPTNAIAVGAAYFAATKEIGKTENAVHKVAKGKSLRIKVAYNRATLDAEEPFSARVDGDTAGLLYQITREDGGFDTGLKKLSARVFEDLPLQKDAFNVFLFRVFDDKHNPVTTDLDPIEITQGIYNPANQMLPQDICLVKDNPDTRDIECHAIFRRNTALPAKTTKNAEVTDTVVKGSSDEIRIKIVEGPAETHPSANLHIGLLAISGKQITRDVHKGTAIDLTFEMSESRHLKVSAHLDATGQDFSEVFTPKKRDVPVKALKREIDLLDRRVTTEIAEAEANNNQDMVSELKAMKNAVEELQGGAMLSELDVTDDRYKLDDCKRKLAQQLHTLTASKHLDKLRGEYREAKSETQRLVNENGNDHERHQMNELLAQEHAFINSSSPQKLRGQIDRLHGIAFQVLRRTPEFLVGWFQHLLEKRSAFNDQLQAKNLIEAGKQYISAQDYDHLAEVNVRLTTLLPEPERPAEGRDFTRIWVS